MRSNCIARLVLAVLASAVPVSRARSQAAPAAADTSAALPLVFLDCQANGCDTDFLRTELTWMNFVRDRNQAAVHIIATSRSTGSGGSELSVTFQATNASGAPADSVTAFIPQGASEDDSRRILSRTIAQGMLRYVRNTPLANSLSVAYRPPTTKAKSDTRGAKDKWHLWVYRLSTSGFASGDENYTSLSLSSSARASRTTEKIKASISFGGSYRQNSYALSETEDLRTYQHSWNTDASVVKSMSARWSYGVQGSAFSSEQSNQDLSVRVAPAIEFDVYPYAQSTRRQIIFRYAAGLRYNDYHEITIFDKLTELHPDHQLLIGSELTQPWGSISGSTSFVQLLDDMSKYNVSVNGFVSWRIATGLNINFGGGYSRIRDQLSLRRGKQETEDVLLRLHQLASGYSYYGNVGLSYTFGSIFQNVVNPRFGLNNFN